VIKQQASEFAASVASDAVYGGSERGLPRFVAVREHGRGGVHLIIPFARMQGTNSVLLTGVLATASTLELIPMTSALNRADINACGIFYSDAGFCNDVRHDPLSI
jgi:hypothetical protein